MHQYLFLFRFEIALPGYAILSFVLGIAMIVMAIISFFGYRHYKLEAEIYSMAWKIQWDDVLPCNAINRNRGSMYSLAKRGSQLVKRVFLNVFEHFNRIIRFPDGVFRRIGIACGRQATVHTTWFLQRMQSGHKTHQRKEYSFESSTNARIEKGIELLLIACHWHRHLVYFEISDERHASRAFSEILWCMCWSTKLLPFDGILSQRLIARYFGERSN